MKVKWDQQTKSRFWASTLVVVIGILLFFFLQNFKELIITINNFLSIFAPFVVGIIIAYLLAPLLNQIELLLFLLFSKKNRHPKLIRSLAVLITFIISLLLVGFLLAIILPQLASSISTLVSNFPSYMLSLQTSLQLLASSLKITPALLDQVYQLWQNFSTQINTFLQKTLMTMLNSSLDFTLGFTRQLFNFVTGLMVAIYLLSQKEKFLAQTRKIAVAILPKAAATKTFYVTGMIHKNFSRYISGQLLDAFVLGLLCLSFMLILGIPYALLVATIVMISNVIPMIGPFIGAIPSAFIILMVDPDKALWFIILILILQQFDGNFMAPRIVGNSTGIASFWVFFAIIVGGSLFGVAGIIIAVPTFSVLQTLLKEAIEARLLKKELPVETEHYLK
ncbi:MAG: AI-2E family transporter [Clostridia bacterium]